MPDTRTRTIRQAALAVLTLAALILLAACGGAGQDEYGQQQTHDAHDSTPASITTGEHSQSGQAGQKLFAANCIQCHGDNAAGTSLGPPLVHQIYEPGHHANAAFVLAVTRGVRAHHWNFGNMPPVEGLTIQEIHQVICYVRELQLANKIIEKVPTSTPC